MKIFGIAPNFEDGKITRNDHFFSGLEKNTDKKHEKVANIWWIVKKIGDEKKCKN
jgi:hypothetical protein